MTDPSTARARVLFIGGWGRSGSTLLDRALGQLPGFVSVGELRELWHRGCLENRPCGCEEPFDRCPFWRAVGEAAFGGWPSAGCGELARLRDELDRPWSVPLTLAGGVGGSPRRSVQRYTVALGRVYRAIQQTSSARVVVDSSKLPSHAFLLRRIPSIDLRVVHLVRDSRGVSFSWQKWVKKRASSGEGDYLYRFDPVSASVRWMLYNGMTHALGPLGTPYLFVRYEDLVADPRKELERILRFVGTEDLRSELGFIEGAEMRLEPNHTVDGNPMRFLRGSVAVRSDEEWKAKMARRDRRTVTAMTFPLLLKYGYPVRAE